MNHRTLIAIMFFLGSARAGVAAAQPAPLTTSTHTDAPASPAAPALTAPLPQMRAFITRDGSQIEAPLFSAESASIPVAKVEDEVVTLGQLAESLIKTHRARQEGSAKQHDFKPVLDRLIGVKLCVFEAQEMALDELPEVQRTIQDEQEIDLIGRVRARAVKDAKAAPAVVDRIYRETVREWQIRALLFDRQEDAAAFRASVRKGKDFDALGKKLLADKKARGSTEPVYSGPAGMLPHVFQYVSKAKPREVGLLRVNEGWSVLQVLGTRYPENREARVRAEMGALEKARNDAADRYYDSLQKQWAKVDQKLLKRLDFEAPKPGFAALRKDQRTLATISGEKPLTVSDLAAGLDAKFFHGIETPIKDHRVNVEKPRLFKKLLQRRLVLKEAARLQIASSEEHRRHMAGFREATLFAAYIDRSVLPGVKVTEDEGRDYFARHKSEFSTPAMYKVESLAFTSAKDAQATLDKLRGGTDFMWLRANAAGQVKDSDRKVQLDGNVVSANALTPDLRSQLAGTNPGDYRLAQVEGQYYVLRVVSATRSQEQRYQDARADIGKKLLAENSQKALDDTIARLRKEHSVAVYLTRISY